ncbi:MAG: hypothetical protein JST54_31510 [Deltaproteobacteria bacterium]|nr:hypothetical protein [Deltaproteobacteria bacterium]
MSLNPAVKRLDNDLSRMHKAEQGQTKELAAEKRANASVKTDGAAEKTALSGIQAKETAIVDQFVSSGAAQDPAQAAKLLGQIFTLGSQYQTTQDKFASKIAGDQSTAAKDGKLAAKDAKSAKADHKQALKDLKPAEYQLSLKATNKDRKELGLKALKKAVRPAGVGGITVTPTMKALASQAVKTAMGMGGYNSQGLCATGVCRTVDDVMHFYPGGNGNTIGNGLLASGKFKQIHIPLAEALKIPGLILSWQHTSTPEGRIYGHTAVTLGNGKESASDFVEYDTLSAAQSRSGLKIFMPTA